MNSNSNRVLWHSIYRKRNVPPAATLRTPMMPSTALRQITSYPQAPRDLNFHSILILHETWATSFSVSKFSPLPDGTHLRDTVVCTVTSSTSMSLLWRTSASTWQLQLEVFTSTRQPRKISIPDRLLPTIYLTHLLICSTRSVLDSSVTLLCFNASDRSVILLNAWPRHTSCTPGWRQCPITRSMPSGNLTHFKQF